MISRLLLRRPYQLATLLWTHGRYLLFVTWLVLIFASNIERDYFYDVVPWIAFASGVPLFCLLARAYHPALALLTAYLIASCHLPILHAASETNMIVTHWLAGKLTMGLLLPGIIIHLFHIDDKRPLTLLARANLLMTYLNIFYFSHHDAVGFLYNHSVSATLTMILLPYLSPLGWILSILTLFFQVGAKPGATSFVVLGAYLLTASLRRRHYWPLLLTPLFYFVTWIPRMAGIYYLNGRREIVAMALRHMHGHWLIGRGFGSFFYYGPFLQQKDQINLSNQIFTTVHCEWVQIVFETGLLGLSLFLITFAAALYHSRRNPQRFYSLVGLMTVMIFFFPLEMPAMVVLIALLFQGALRRENLVGVD